MIFSILESPALHNKTKQIAGRKKKELKIHYYYILCWSLSPWGAGGGEARVAGLGGGDITER